MEKIKKNRLYFLIAILVFAILSVGFTFLIEFLFPNITSLYIPSLGNWDNSQFSGMPNYLTITPIEKFLYFFSRNFLFSVMFCWIVFMLYFCSFLPFKTKPIFPILFSIFLFIISFLIIVLTKNFLCFFLVALFFPCLLSLFFLFREKFSFLFLFPFIISFATLIYLGLFRLVFAIVVLLLLLFVVFFFVMLVKKKMKTFFIRVASVFIALIIAFLFNSSFFLSLIEYSNYSSALNIKNIYQNDISIKSLKCEDYIISEKYINEKQKKESYDFRTLNILNSEDNVFKFMREKLIQGKSKYPLTSYENLFNNYLNNSTGEINSIKNIIYSAKISELEKQELEDIFAEQSKINILNMLNLGFVFYDEISAPIVNSAANNNAWFVDTCIFVKEEEELVSLKDFDSKKTAILSYQYEDLVSKNNIATRDTNATIYLIESQDNSLTYKYSSNSDQLIVFSEIYYPKTWTVTIDGEPSSFFRANYLLRAMYLPKGENIIKFNFESLSCKYGFWINCLMIFCFCIFVVVFVLIKINREKRQIRL